MTKGDISILLRKLHLMQAVDKLRFYYFKIKHRKKNREFLQKHPEAALPPDYYIYEAFQLNYEEYLTKSKKTAQWILDFYIKHKKREPEKVLDWGCGPGRIIRHLPALLPASSKIYGTDYNAKSIEWCKNNLKGIDFNKNSIDAILPYNDNYFDYIFGISIFTHLSAQKHAEWIEELTRVLKPGGLMMLTTHGNDFRVKLSKKELAAFDAGNIVVRDKVKEGHRTYTAYHPAEYMEKLFTGQGLKILEHVSPETISGKPQQDVWILEKL
jgi:ubiquinone/menaquinone biosynthesis C-methylase UbiE